MAGESLVSSEQVWTDRGARPLRSRSDPTDQILRNSRLRRLHVSLKHRIESYIGLYEAGSVAAGDPWVEGRSDRDILIVLDKLTKESVEQITEQLKDGGFNDNYLFYMAPKQAFLRAQSDYSMKFRGVTLFGEDLLAEKVTPSREFVERWADTGLRAMPAKLRIRAVNGGYWSIERLRDELYMDLKQMFMFLADRWYSDTGVYPKRRLDVASAYESEALRELAETLVHIDSADRQRLIDSARSAFIVLQQLLAERPSAAPERSPRHVPSRQPR